MGQMAADIFGREILTSGVANDSTVGGALVALQAVTGGNQAQVYRPEITSRLVPPSGVSGVPATLPEVSGAL